jgi:hypothetical protein
MFLPSTSGEQMNMRPTNMRVPRARLRVSQLTVPLATGINPSRWKIENGLRDATVAERTALTKYLERPAEEIFGGGDER